MLPSQSSAYGSAKTANRSCDLAAKPSWQSQGCYERKLLIQFSESRKRTFTRILLDIHQHPDQRRRWHSGHLWVIMDCHSDVLVSLEGEHRGFVHSTDKINNTSSIGNIGYGLLERLGQSLGVVSNHELTEERFPRETGNGQGYNLYVRAPLKGDRDCPGFR